MSKETDLLIVANTAAIDLVSTNNSGLSIEAIKTRLIRISDDLKAAVEESNQE